MYTAINDRSSIQYGRRTQQNVILLKRDQIQDFVNNTARELEAGTFRAENIQIPRAPENSPSYRFSLCKPGTFNWTWRHCHQSWEELVSSLVLLSEEFLRVIWQISILHILDLKELKISLPKTSSGGKGSQNDIQSMSRLIWLPTVQKMLSVRRDGPRIFSSSGLMDTVSQRHRLTLRIGPSMAGTDRQYGMWIQEKPTFLWPLTVAAQIRTGSENIHKRILWPVRIQPGHKQAKKIDSTTTQALA